MSSKRIYHFRKQNGLCVKCGEKLDRKGTRCKTCADYDNEYSKRYYYDKGKYKKEETYNHRKKYNMCPRCGKRHTYTDEQFILCNECREKEKIERKRRNIRSV